MYQLEEGEKADPCMAFNATATLAMAGQWKEAADLLPQLTADSELMGDPATRRVVAAVQAKEMPPTRIVFH